MKITFKKGHWFYPDGHEMNLLSDSPTPLWVSKDGMIRLMDYNDKSDANKQVRLAKKVFSYGE